MPSFNGCRKRHRHAGCRYATNPATRPDFWADKFTGNVQRDGRNHAALLALGWRVATVWECALRNGRLEQTAVELDRWLRGDALTLEIG